ncbi:MAG TPA: helix-turn-helix domain-containing protein [Candidatus Omnitrophota bacterium]|nr:excisionase family DNA-binding protein [Candidatus Omnitrophota bacterium]MDD5270927.1 helix-turn-helix domain-containing protein [Candidatus Omnitrophota bacterium]HOX09771.1 helix-turn-helix domain-containing protein [Candidatus Omnitrophota bacterium]HPN66274.1 helix-turn-helix domain-containing protein [Candidatus Omnitrophota bacterium]HRZ66762.1 helix-turn-helix domain-containing protein [Candidatus Omnitrophota bacterium]
MVNKGFLTTSEAAKLLGISRISVFMRIKKGYIKAIKIGRNYAIPRESILSVIEKKLSEETKKQIEDAVRKTVREYGRTLKLLGGE